MSAPLRVAILWHMHQPDYRDPGTTSLVFPWVRLHALKDYLDMPLRAAQYPHLRCTFNLVPSLLDQLDAYRNGWDDPHLRLCRLDPESATQEDRSAMLTAMFPGHPPTMFRPFARYQELYQKFEETSPLAERAIQHFTSQELRDLQVWSNLVWIDPLFRREPPVRELYAKGRNFSEAEKTELLDWQLRRLQDVTPTYQRLVREDRIEVSLTPYYHPILPLLCDSRSALEALPDLTLPSVRYQFPEDAVVQIRRARSLYQRTFGGDLRGMWPSEGSVSEEVLGILAQQGTQWCATDEEVLAASYRKGGQTYDANAKFRVHEYQGVRMLFRDHQLSDRIGFVYSGWDAARAADDFMGHVRDISRALGDRRSESVLPIILDGENAWEYFPDDGDAFLHEWYRRLNDAHEAGEIALVTAAEAVQSLPAVPLARVQAGSWINHNFRIWIGHPEDNRAWELLAQTRSDLERALKTRTNFSADLAEKCWEQIYRAEGSDWFWWFGDEHVGPDNPLFDDLFRRHLRGVYHLLSLPVPDALLQPIGGKAITPPVRLTPPSGFLSPVIDGKVTTFYEWSGAGCFELTGTGGAMHRVDSHFHRLQYAFDEARLCLLLEWRGQPRWQAGTALRLFVNRAEVCRHRWEGSSWQQEFPASMAPGSDVADPQRICGVIGRVAEWGIPRGRISSSANGVFSVHFDLESSGSLLEQWPAPEQLRLMLPEHDMAYDWPL